MHVLEYLHRNVKTVAMPTAMVAGALLCRPVAALEGWTQQMITPSLIFLMLFFTFCRVKPRQMKPSMLHLWLLLFQVVVSVAVYFLLLPLNPIVAQGAMICVLLWWLRLRLRWFMWIWLAGRYNSVFEYMK